MSEQNATPRFVGGPHNGRSVPKEYVDRQVPVLAMPHLDVGVLLGRLYDLAEKHMPAFDLSLSE